MLLYLRRPCMLRADPTRGKKNMTMNHVCSYIVMLSINSTVCARYLILLAVYVVYIIRVVKDTIIVLLGYFIPSQCNLYIQSCWWYYYMLVSFLLSRKEQYSQLQHSKLGIRPHKQCNFSFCTSQPVGVALLFHLNFCMNAQLELFPLDLYMHD